MRYPRQLMVLVWIGVSLLPVVAHAQQSAPPKRVLLLNWYDKNDPTSLRFDATFGAALQSAGNVELYTEYLESNRFPGADQALALRDYLKRKYAERSIDVVVANSDASLVFLLEHRAELFPQTPMVFIGTRHPSKEEIAAGPGLTGITALHTHRETLDLALRLHPKTQQVFVISGTLEHDRRIETFSRQELQGYESRLLFTYLTDLSLQELIAKVKNLPEHSIVLHIWQQAKTEEGKVLESADLIDSVARASRVPVYSMSFMRAWLESGHSKDGSRVMGGYVNTPAIYASKAAEIALRITNGARPQDIPVEPAPGVAMLNWRELKRWGISENALPPGSQVFFKEVTFWDLYKWRIIGVLILLLTQSLLIAFLLVERSRRRQATNRLLTSQRQFATTFRVNPQPMSLTTLDEGRYIDVNDSFLNMSGYSREEVIGNTSIDLNIWETAEIRAEVLKQLKGETPLRNTETRFRTKDGSFRVLLSSVETLSLDGKPSLLFASTDITERKRAEDRFRRFFDLPLVGMAVTSPDRSFLVVNEKLCQMLGYSEKELIGLKWSDVTHPDDIAENVRLLEQTLGGETEGYAMDKRFIRRDQKIVFASISASCVRREDGTVDHLVLIVQDITKRKQAEQWLSKLTARLLTTQDQERRRIAQELHDVTAQSIGLMLLNLAYLEKAATEIDSRSKDKLAECVALGEQALREIRTLSYVLHPPLLDQAGLVTALRWYAKGFTERSGIQVDFSDSGSDGHRMPPDVEYSLFRVVQECLTNIRRHTNSETANITLTRTDEQVILKVRDRGTGLGIEASTNGDGIETLGVGIPGMRHRLKQLDGELAVDSASDGTTVTATVPVKWVIYDSNPVS